MQQALVIVPLLDKKFDFRAAKAKIAKYLGERLIVENPNDSPTVIVKESLTQEDKMALQKSVFEDNKNGSILYVMYDGNTTDDNGYLTLSVVED